MKGIENRLTKLELAHPAEDFVRLPDDPSLWTEESMLAVAQWCERNRDIQAPVSRDGCNDLRPGPFDDLSPENLKALHNAFVELQETGEWPATWCGGLKGGPSQ